MAWSERGVSRRIVRVLFRLVFALTVFATMLVASEYALRYWYRHVRSSGNAADYFAAAHPPRVSNNSLGFRDREPGPKDPQRYRIAVVGDSFTWGQGIEAAVSRYVAASNRGDADALTQLYADDAVLLPPAHEPIEGREAIGAFWHQGTDQGLEVTTLKVEVNGDLGYQVGRYHLPATDEEPADSGKYVMCLKRQLDGSWKLTADIWNSSGDSNDDSDEEPQPPSSIS